MEDRAILLKIKRDFTTNEAVQSLLKIIAELEKEIGILKSDLSEAQDRIYKLEYNEKRTKKQWLKDDLIAMMDKEIRNNAKNVTEINKVMNNWRNKYFSLLANITNNIAK